jgi:hypothetical protein
MDKEYIQYKYCRKCKKSKQAKFVNKLLCTTCGKETKDRQRKMYNSKEYKIIARDKRLKKEYGIGIDDYNKMFNEQNGACYICKKHQSELNSTLAVDHCHKTGKVRGLLCYKCNTALGLIYESIGSLINMIDYIKKHNKNK